MFDLHLEDREAERTIRAFASCAEGWHPLREEYTSFSEFLEGSGGGFCRHADYLEEALAVYALPLIRLTFLRVEVSAF